MFRVFLFINLLLSCNIAFADNIIYSGTAPNYGSFKSELKMNQPKNIVGAHINPQRRYYNRSHCPGCLNYNIPNSNLGALERYALKKNYNRESDITRLERLENLAFGATQIGDPATRYQNVENAILSRPQPNYKRSFLGNIANYFSGQATGFTPSITNFNDNFTQFGGMSLMPAPGYNNRNFEQYSNGIFGGGWGLSEQNYGSGSSVRILD